MQNLKQIWNYGLKNGLEKKIKSFLLFFLAIYQCHVSGYTGGACRFYPSCSDYAKAALKTYSLIDALKIIVKRLVSCRPFGAFGFDPICKRDGK